MSIFGDIEFDKYLEFYIFQFLNIDDLKIYSSVCRYYRNLIKNEYSQSAEIFEFYINHSKNHVIKNIDSDIFYCKTCKKNHLLFTPIVKTEIIRPENENSSDSDSDSETENNCETENSSDFENNCEIENHEFYKLNDNNDKPYNWVVCGHHQCVNFTENLISHCDLKNNMNLINLLFPCCSEFGNFRSYLCYKSIEFDKFNAFILLYNNNIKLNYLTYTTIYDSYHIFEYIFNNIIEQNKVNKIVSITNIKNIILRSIIDHDSINIFDICLKLNHFHDIMVKNPFMITLNATDNDSPNIIKKILNNPIFNNDDIFDDFNSILDNICHSNSIKCLKILYDYIITNNIFDKNILDTHMNSALNHSAIHDSIDVFGYIFNLGYTDIKNIQNFSIKTLEYLCYNICYLQPNHLISYIKHNLSNNYEIEITSHILLKLFEMLSNLLDDNFDEFDITDEIIDIVVNDNIYLFRLIYVNDEFDYSKYNIPHPYFDDNLLLKNAIENGSAEIYEEILYYKFQQKYGRIKFHN